MFGKGRFRSAIVLGAMIVAVSGCAGAASATVPIPPGAVRVTQPAQAVARVLIHEPRLNGIQPFDSGLIGQSSWYTVDAASGVGAYVVKVRIGWGDCEAGCINEHAWAFAVAPDGAVTVVSDEGQPVPPDAWPSPIGAGRTGIAGIAVAGPVCPVESIPPDPDCAPRPVVDATVVIRDHAGSEVARALTAVDGSFFVELPAGDYEVEPQPVDGMMGTAGPMAVTVEDGIAAQVQLEYDTGIR